MAAIRLVVTEPAVDQNADVKKRTGSTRHFCGLGGVVLLGTGGAHRAGRAPISVYNAESGRLLRDIPINQPGVLAFDGTGRLLAVSEGGRSAFRWRAEKSRPSSPPARAWRHHLRRAVRLSLHLRYRRKRGQAVHARGPCPRESLANRAGSSGTLRSRAHVPTEGHLFRRDGQSGSPNMKCDRKKFPSGT